MDTPDRLFPKGRALRSTKSYVESYYRLNQLGDPSKLFEPLSLALATRPDTVIPNLRGIAPA